MCLRFFWFIPKLLAIGKSRDVNAFLVYTVFTTTDQCRLVLHYRCSTNLWMKPEEPHPLHKANIMPCKIPPPPSKKFFWSISEKLYRFFQICFSTSQSLVSSYVCFRFVNLNFFFSVVSSPVLPLFLIVNLCLFSCI